MPELSQSFIDHGASYDWGRASEYYAKYRDIYPASFYEHLQASGIGLPGQHVLDLGTGTGVVPRALCRLEPTLRCTGVDIAPAQIEMAQALSQGMPIDYAVCPAEDIAFPPDSFGAVTACQCFWYFNREVLLPKLHAQLKPGGLLGILSMAWLSRQSKIARQSERMVLRYNPKWTGGNFHKVPFLPKPRWASPLFRLQKRILYCEDIPFTREAWHGRMLSCRGIGAAFLPQETIAAFNREHQAFLATLPEIFSVPHQVMMVILEKLEKRV